MANLTLLYALKDRPAFLKRTLEYLRSCNTSHHIFFADGSSFNNHMTHLDILSDFQDVPNTYKYYGQDHSFLDFYKKLLLATNDIGTKYVVLACDDDFYNFCELKCGLDFLASNSDYSTYTGSILNFTISNPSSHIRGNAYGNPEITEHCYKGLNRNIHSNQISERMNYLNNEKPYESIHYTSNLRLCFQILVELDVKSYYYFEYLLKLISIYSGKSFASNNEFLLRQDNTMNSSGASLINDYSLFDDNRSIHIIDSICKKLFSYYDVNSSDRSELILKVYSNFILLIYGNGNALFKSIENNKNQAKNLRHFIKKIKILNLLISVLKDVKYLFKRTSTSRNNHNSSFIESCFKIVSNN